MRECLDDEARLEDFAVELKQWQYDEGGPQVLENFIAFEGLDGAGTSTQARLLEAYFVACGHLCERSAEPTQGATGRHIRAILRQAPDNAEALIQKAAIAPVLCDRSRRTHSRTWWNLGKSRQRLDMHFRALYFFVSGLPGPR